MPLYIMKNIETGKGGETNSERKGEICEGIKKLIEKGPDVLERERKALLCELFKTAEGEKCSISLGGVNSRVIINPDGSYTVHGTPQKKGEMHTSTKKEIDNHLDAVLRGELIPCPLPQ